MSSAVWQLQEAKSRFSEVVEQAIKHGAQTVTKHGRPAVVIFSAEDYRRSNGPKKSLLAALRQCPEDLTKLMGKRSKVLLNQQQALRSVSHPQRDQRSEHQDFAS